MVSCELGTSKALSGVEDLREVANHVSIRYEDRLGYMAILRGMFLDMCRALYASHTEVQHGRLPPEGNPQMSPV